MLNRWDEQQARACLQDGLALRVYTSRLLGAEADLVLFGGGNTSVKLEHTDVFGHTETLLYVKGSGWDLATITEAGFAPVKLSVLEKMAALPALSDQDMVRLQRGAMTQPDAPSPSVEAILHAIIPYRYVDHTHADAVVTLTNTPDGEALIRSLYGDSYLIVPYVKPGFDLAKCIYTMTRDCDWSTLSGMILMNHGVFTFSDCAKTAYSTMIECVTQAELWLQRQGAWVDFSPAPAPIAWEDVVQLAGYRQVLSRRLNKPMLARMSPSQSVRQWLAELTDPQVLQRGLLTPDHVIRNKRLPLQLAANQSFEAALDEYQAQYEAYFEQESQRYSEPLTPLDPMPRWMCVAGAGVVSFGDHAAATAVTESIAMHTLQAIARAQRCATWAPLSASAVFDVEYWVLEQMKLQRQATRLPFAGKVVFVTGANSGIGLACVNAYLAKGAAVIALDRVTDRLATVSHTALAYFTADVTDGAAVAAAVIAGVARFGGIDILVSSVGCFTESMLLEQQDQQRWDNAMTVNLTSHQQLLTRLIPFLKRGIDANVVFIGSKNVDAPGPGVAAYSVSKAGLTQLARVAALELAPYAIRVNVVHPNAVFDTGLWTDAVLAARAAHYDMSVNEYKTNNLLKTEILSHDVAEMVCSVSGSAFQKTTGAQFPIDGGNERVI